MSCVSGAFRGLEGLNVTVVDLSSSAVKPGHKWPGFTALEDKKGLMRLARKGQEIDTPAGAIKEPIVLEIVSYPWKTH